MIYQQELEPLLTSRAVMISIAEVFAILLLILLIWYVIKRVRRNRDSTIRNASLTVEELENHAKKTAIEHAVSSKKNILNWPMVRMNDNYSYILAVYKKLNDDLNQNRSVPPAAEWLLDNFYIVEEQVKSIRLELKKKDYFALPILKRGPLKGYSRVYAIATELVTHLDGQIEETTLIKYLEAYQSHSILFDREIWIIPTIIRLVLIESIRDVCENIEETCEQWSKADELVEKWWSDSVVDAEKLIKTFKSTVETISEPNQSFVEHLFYRLRRSGRSYTAVLKSIDQHLDKYAATTETIAQKEHNKQAISTVSIGNCVISLKYVSSMNWTNLFEQSSYVEKILMLDPDGTYVGMDVDSRNAYRLHIQKMAKMYGVSELHIAREAIDLARQALQDSQNRDDKGMQSFKTGHVGYFLVGKGLKILEGKQRGKAKPHARTLNQMKSRPGMLYMALILTLSFVIMAFVINYGVTHAKDYLVGVGLIIGILTLIPASEMAIAFVHWIVCNIKKPSVFPRLELKDGIPEHLSTMVVVPTLLPDKKRVIELLETMENHYLSNKENNLYFALIGAFKDSVGPEIQDDNQILVEATSGIRALNLKYAKEDKDIFYFYHRLSQYNEIDDNRTGWERKRGALMEFNELLQGSKDTSFAFFSHANLPSTEIKYVITLDADTILPLGMAKRMIGTMAHPLNTPVIDPERGVVTEGYGLMQPKVSFDMDSSNRSIFSRIYTGQEGIDPYASSISDVYQDLFGEGIFTGKGIYDLAVFQKVMHRAIPENAILSHDLLEGSYVRAALVSDLELVDSYPSKYNAFVSRLHRWIRGDWQLIPWLRPMIMNKDRKWICNPLSLISMWKIGDNLRRSLVAPSIMMLILLGISVLPGNGIFWIGLGIAALILPLVINFWSNILGGGLKPDKIKRHMPGFFGIKSVLFQFLLSLVFLPYQSLVALSAISVTLYRVLVSQKNMLEWVTSADAEKNQSNTLLSYLYTMSGAVFLGIFVMGLSAVFKPESMPIGFALGIIWMMSPIVAYYISLDDQVVEEKLEKADLEELRKIARKTWRYFEEFSNVKNNHLIPDNYQEDPPRGVAYRTSPTNIGLGLLATLSARDFGFMGLKEMTEALSRTVSTIEKLEKWNGHLYNWYDTKTLEPLHPFYVSTVDSGNFVGYLMTLIQGLKKYANSPIVDKVFVKGLSDTLMCGFSEGGALLKRNDYMLAMEQQESVDLYIWSRALSDVPQHAGELNLKARIWQVKFESMVRNFYDELGLFTPWIFMIEKMPVELLDAKLVAETTDLLALLKTNSSLIGLPEIHQKSMMAIQVIKESIGMLEDEDFQPCRLWLEELVILIEHSSEKVALFRSQLDRLVERIEVLSHHTKFDILYDDKRQLFSIGYDIDKRKLTNSYYDLLASEARQTSYIAIARGEVPPKHWFVLGRSLTVVDHFKGLVSWSGTMFEYLMPLLIMRTYKNTLLDETYSFVVKSQKKYGKQRGMPWGTSESSYNALDINLDYQYKAIGVPWLGLKRGLIEDAVTAPYATFMALMVRPLDAFDNIMYLKSEGLEGPYGYYEAADYTPERLGFDTKHVIIKSYMAHHQGMTLLALNNYLHHNIMQLRFSADPRIKSTRLLLQEKVPLNVVFTKDNKEKILPFKGLVYKDSGSIRHFTEPDQVLPRTHVLSNGNYYAMVTDQGSGYSRNRTTALSRWRDDGTLDGFGMFLYIKNIDENTHWSATYAPLNVLPKDYNVTFKPDKAVFKRTDGKVETSTEIVVATGDSAEIRRIKLKNISEESCVLEVTSYLELVLTTQQSDTAHPAFSNLFVKTEYDEENKALIANRRSRSEGDKGMWVAQIPVIDGECMGDIQYETDRMQFVGRGRTVHNPVILDRDKPLSNTVGPVLDPVFSLRIRLKVDAGKTARVSYVTVMANSKEDILDLLEKYKETEACDAAFWLAITRSQVEMKYLNISAIEMELYQKMISDILFISPLKRKFETLIQENKKGQSALWPYGISGDRPIVLVILNRTEQIDILYEVLKAHEYWRVKDLRVDLVIVSQEDNNYANPLHGLISDIVYSTPSQNALNHKGDIFILNEYNMMALDLNLLCAVAKVILTGDGGTLREQSKAMPVKDQDLNKNGGETNDQQ